MGTVINTFKYYLLKLWLLVSAQIPLVMLQALAKLAGWLFSVLPNRARSTTEKNLHTCFPDLSAKQLQQLTRQSLQNTACTALEMGKAWLWPIHKTVGLVVETEGYEDYQTALQAGKGVILMAPHLSNWEVFGFFACHQTPSTFMYQPPRQAAVDRLLREVRSRSGVNLAPTNRKGVAQVLAALQAGEMVGILPDQVPADESGVFVPFFGEPAFTMTLISKLASRTGAAVFCGFAQRLPGGRGFRAVFQKAEEAIHSSDVATSATSLNRSVEKVVSLAPSQYQWEYKRFRRQPDDSEFY